MAVRGEALPSARLQRRFANQTESLVTVIISEFIIPMISVIGNLRSPLRAKDTGRSAGSNLSADHKNSLASSEPLRYIILQ